MSDSIKLEVFDRTTGERRQETVELPVEIGKSPRSSSYLKLSSDRPTISRSHGRIERLAGQLHYIDKSSNGSKVAGTSVHNAQRALQPGDKIDIEAYEIGLIDSQALLLKLTDDKLTQIGELRLEPDEQAVVTGPEKTPRFAISDDGGDDASDPLLTLVYTGSALELAAHDADNAPDVKINNRSVTLPSRATYFDVIAIGGHRIEVLLVGQDKIVCGNPECHLLNDLPFEENCVWCGYYLAASGSFTRVTPP